MKKIILIFIIVSSIIFSEDIKLPQFFYIGLLYQRNDLKQNDYDIIGIIELGENKNRIYDSIIKNNPKEGFSITKQGELLLSEFENLTNVDFLQCRLEKLEILKKDLRFPLILKEIKGDDEKSYKALVILNEDLYKYGNGILPMENYLKGMLMYKDYFCPKYFNGE